MDQYLIMVINSNGEEQIFAKETDRGVFDAIEMVKNTYVYTGVEPLSEAVQVMAKKVEPDAT